MKINEVLKRRRQELGLTQDEVAPQLGLSIMGLSYLEHGQRQLKIETLQKWANLLKMGVSVTVTRLDDEEQITL